ncbi:MAG: NAD-dependent protein deacylase [Actinomycetia bacterium]|nr:NAD-dependent protein deacylase [Actinomycetes bacterium]
MDASGQLAQWLLDSSNSVFFGGAGVSTASGIPDFRSAAGLYAASRINGYTPEELLSHQIFQSQPELFYDYYRQNLLAPEAQPNAAHWALARLEDAGQLQAVITQNVDGLHQAAGSQRVIELHGSNWRPYCLGCGRRYTLDYLLDTANCQPGSLVPCCSDCGGVVRPDVVLYGEQLDAAVLTAARQAMAAAELLIVGGTSLAVYPAAGLLDYFSGRHLVLINQTTTPRDSQADLVIAQNIATVLDAAQQVCAAALNS